jgi:hypothetical protein
MKFSSKAIRRMGFIRDQSGIMNRYLRETRHWEPHLEKTREFIRNSFTGQDYESVTVLGSGWLLDVPLDHLAGRFRKVTLVDIFHPPQIRKKVKDLDHVQLVETDLTGGAVEQIWQLSKKRGALNPDSLPEMLHLEPPLPRIRSGVVVSVNLLNQLDIHLCDFLRDCGWTEDEPMDRCRELIQSFHIDWITASPGCIITDAAEINRDRSGKETIKPLLYTELPLGIRRERWIWEFDTSATYRSGFRTRMEVRAVEWT